MKSNIWPDDVSMLQMNDWLAELRDENRAEPPDGDPRPEAPTAAAPDGSVAAGRDGSVAAAPDGSVAAAPDGSEVHGGVPAREDAPAWASATGGAGWPAPVSPAGVADASARVDPASDAGLPAQVRPAADASVRAVIGDEIRMPIMWCEMGSCISWYTHPAALGEADTRARAIAAGWRIDALGRLACPGCQQTDPCFWASQTVVPWDRYTAIARTARIAAVRSDDARDSTAMEISHERSQFAGDPSRKVNGYSAARPEESVWLRAYAAAGTW